MRHSQYGLIGYHIGSAKTQDRIATKTQTLCVRIMWSDVTTEIGNVLWFSFSMAYYLCLHIVTNIMELRSRDMYCSVDKYTLASTWDKYTHIHTSGIGRCEGKYK